MKHAVASLAMLFAVSLMAGCATQEGPATTRPDESLVNTYWKLTVLDGESPDVVDGQREPHFVLHADPARVMGSTGCNRMMGCLLYTSPSPRDKRQYRMPSSA